MTFPQPVPACASNRRLICAAKISGIPDLSRNPPLGRLSLVVILPVVLGLPSMIFPVPPLVIGAPASFPLGIQFPPPVFGLAAALAIIMDRLIQPRFRLFNCVLTVRSVVGMRPRRRRKKCKSSHHNCCRRCVSKFSNQDSFSSLISNEPSRFYEYRPATFDTVHLVLPIS
jgi:hypothetical protein